MHTQEHEINPPRARLECDGLGKYTVIDCHYQTVVIQTSSKTIAEMYRDRVNGCKHDRPYDILWHSHK